MGGARGQNQRCALRRGAARYGATPEEVAETIAVTMAMEGGPATVYGPRAWEAYQEFAGGQAESTPAS